VIRPIIERLGKPTELASLDLAAGEALLCLERYKKAIPKLNNAAKHALPGSCIHGQALVLLSKAYASLKQDKIASRYCKKALDVLKENAKSAVTGASLVELASVLQSLQEHEKSMAVLEIALQAYQQQPVEQAAAAYIECQIGRSYLSLNKFGEASAYLERSSAKIETLHGPESPELLDVYNHLGIAYMRLERLDAAIAKFEAAQAILKLSDVTDSEVTITLYNNLACLYDMVGR
jgi:tetratricopeptide (TPR) repeat protein